MIKTTLWRQVVIAALLAGGSFIIVVAVGASARFVADRF